MMMMIFVCVRGPAIPRTLRSRDRIPTASATMLSGDRPRGRTVGGRRWCGWVADPQQHSNRGPTGSGAGGVNGTKIIIIIACCCSCHHGRPAPRPASEVLLSCGQAQISTLHPGRPSAGPAIRSVHAGRPFQPLTPPTDSGPGRSSGGQGRQCKFRDFGSGTSNKNNNKQEQTSNVEFSGSPGPTHGQSTKPGPTPIVPHGR